MSVEEVANRTLVELLIHKDEEIKRLAQELVKKILTFEELEKNRQNVRLKIG